jgi:hypothetical protein
MTGEIIIFVFGILFIMIGVTNLNPKLRVWSINYTNRMRGVKTKITETTHRIAFFHA